MKTWNNTDKSKWDDGEWMGEPDKAHWIDGETNLDCLIVRGPSGALCGYVGVPKGHRLYGVDYNNAQDIDGEYLECHGGLTFSDKCQPTDNEAEHICHPKKDAANEEVWWLGFDCAHSGDVCPRYISNRFYTRNESYKTLGYVKREAERLAKQIARG